MVKSIYKLYIPLDKEHIFDGANQLFDFLIREKIPHVSKIGKYISMDDIVVRVDTPENAYIKDSCLVIEAINA